MRSMNIQLLSVKYETQGFSHSKLLLLLLVLLLSCLFPCCQIRWSYVVLKDSVPGVGEACIYNDSNTY